MQKGDQVHFINNQNEIDSEVCDIVECMGNFCRIKRPNGQIIRIYNDRLRLVTGDTQMGDEIKNDEVIKNEDKYNPWDNLPAKGEVWIKSNRFSDSVICETIAIIDPDSDTYKSINTYNGKAQKLMVYSMKNYEVLIKRMIRKGYEKKSNNNT